MQYIILSALFKFSGNCLKIKGDDERNLATSSHFIVTKNMLMPNIRSKTFQRHYLPYLCLNVYISRSKEITWDYHFTSRYIATHNIIVGNPLTENSDAMWEYLVQSILATFTGLSICCNSLATSLKIGSKFLQWPHQGA